MDSESVQEGIEHIKKAVQEDENGNYDDAFDKYVAGLECFKKHLKGEEKEDVKQVIRTKFAEYLERAEYLKTILTKKEPRETSTVKKGSSEQREVGTSGSPLNVKTKDRRPETSFIVALSERTNSKFDDLVGLLEQAKETLTETVVMPLRFPQLFNGRIRPRIGTLLYGPPSVGKTTLAKVIANEAGALLFNYSISEVLKESSDGHEMHISAIFKNARNNAPAVLLLQDIDKLHTTDLKGVSVGSFKEQFINEMKMLEESGRSSVVVLGETSHPEKMDPSVRSVLTSRIYIPLPEAPARTQLFQQQLDAALHVLSEAHFQKLAEITERFTPNDIATAVKGALLQQIRFVRQATHFRRISESEGSKFVPCDPNAPYAVKRTWQYFAENSLGDRVTPAPLSFTDIEALLQQSKPKTTRSEIKIYARFKEEFGG